VNDPKGVGKGFAPSADAANKALGGIVKQDAHPPGTAGTTYSLNKMGELVRDGRNDPRIRGWAGQCIARSEALGLAKHVDSTAWVEQTKIPSGGYHVSAKTSGREIASASAAQLAGAWQELSARLRGISNLHRDYGKLKTATKQSQAILDEIRRVTYYTQDPVNTEEIARPHITLCLDDHGLCMPASDCDDRCVCFASATLSLGIETMVVGQAYGTEQATHVICAILDPDTGWQKVDPSTDDWPVGRVHPATKEWWMDPISGSVAHSAQGKVMTIGKEPEHGDYIGVGAIPFEHAYGAVDEGCAQSPAYVTPDLMHGACPTTRKVGPCPNPVGCCGPQVGGLGYGIGLGQTADTTTSAASSSTSLPLGLAITGMLVGAVLLGFVAWEEARK
jgi:hypothetical protein